MLLSGGYRLGVRVNGPGYGDQMLSLRVLITQLRKKIETDSAQPKLIITEPGVGYRFQSQAA